MSDWADEKARVLVEDKGGKEALHDFDCATIRSLAGEPCDCWVEEQARKVAAALREARERGALEERRGCYEIAANCEQERVRQMVGMSDLGRRDCVEAKATEAGRIADKIAARGPVSEGGGDAERAEAAVAAARCDHGEPLHGPCAEADLARAVEERDAALVLVKRAARLLEDQSGGAHWYDAKHAFLDEMELRGLLCSRMLRGSQPREAHD